MHADMDGNDGISSLIDQYRFHFLYYLKSIIIHSAAKNGTQDQRSEMATAKYLVLHKLILVYCVGNSEYNANTSTYWLQ
jgi:hypothetical protein